ncbi:hypothetical protein HK097_003708 [Rhizophlyctis rosea]|uniref:MRG-binding protein n=1 Tax=Rhizophlyctis rosea TaxID=64517 RepID=A0AAD5SKP7_9FUNG|nr:hypothetical protein HK097_003708 [Rhizophlyctis rosea]
MSATPSPTKQSAPDIVPMVSSTSDRPPSSAHSSTSTAVPAVEWTPDLEVPFFQGVARFRPVGVHKHFRMLNVQRFFKKQTGLVVTIEQLWDRLGHYYNLEALDGLADESDEEMTSESRRKRSAYPFKVTTEFTLPAEDFESIITEHRRAESGSDGEGDEVMSEAASRKDKRDSSPMSSASARSTPEPAEAEETSKGRRPGRPRKASKAQLALSEPPPRRTRSGSGAGQTLTPTPAAKKKRTGK